MGWSFGVSARSWALLFTTVAGVQGATPRQCSSGVVIVKVHQVTGAYQLMQVGSTIYSGANMVHLRAYYLGLAWGFEDASTPTGGRSMSWETTPMPLDNNSSVHHPRGNT
ncbi:hypothetical protein PF008_g29529 [Phytophthora fragariae]|uniref:Uncharacterized protein n=1 Tax=Phytophthora fragariae TaxID=53985 RepID=A0A6G0Q8N4_9STRA|nr:hypothetical protein PF008_g29529 [Phytophthora fragariae]